MGVYQLAAAYYDSIYATKDYDGEAAALLQWLSAHGLRNPDVLDLACGTGRHLLAMQGAGCRVAGLDLEPDLLELARQRLPAVTLHQASMESFALPERFDLISCWFGGIGYLTSLDGVRKAVECWMRHLKPRGWLMLEPFIQPDEFQPGQLHTITVQEADFHLVRMVVSSGEPPIYSSDFHYLLGTAQDGVRHFTERHELRMHRTDELRELLSALGLSVHHEPSSITARGVFLAQSSQGATSG